MIPYIKKRELFCGCKKDSKTMKSRYNRRICNYLLKKLKKDKDFDNI